MSSDEYCLKIIGMVFAHITRGSISLKEPVGEIPALLLRSIAQRARPAPGARLDCPQLDLASARECVPDELPVDEVR